ncbi:MAG: L-2-hydroxyglutarate oxidase [Gemmatimonadales bacterium]|nr:L-2-hydroxyglutarate oxidase [Gemmatimonadales bacterium]
MFDYAVIGGGIIGLATAMTLGKRYPGAQTVLLEKEPGWGRHQTGRNSGVIHSGIYYVPGSLKATLCRAGNRSLVAFGQEHGIPHEVCGKVIVATNESESPALERLYRRGLDNGLEVRKMRAEEVREIEPHVECLGGIHVPSAGIIDFRQVCLRFAELAEQNGVELRLNSGVTAIRPVTGAGGYRLDTSQGEVAARYVINCAGLHSDRVTRLGGADPGAKIIPFRGEYYALREGSRHLVKHMVYPVPNPDFPFLGVHLTRLTSGAIHAGPNAVLALKREGYGKSDFDLRDLSEVLSYPGFWRLATRHFRVGIGEVVRSYSKAAFVKSLQKLIPEITADDLSPSHAGVRAQALRSDGTLVDDFLLVEKANALHVLNAPSPAATASLEIGKVIVSRVPAPRGGSVVVEQDL